MSGRPRKACQQCSSLKVRCTGDKPVCRRCARLHRPCTWKTVSKPSPRRSSILETPQSTSTPTLGNGRYAGISPAMLSVLVDLYFTHMYNAALLIHRPSFTRALTQGVAKPHVVLSLCAVASIFYDSSDDEESLRNNGTFLSWAEQAGKLVFAEIDTPTEDNLVSFVHLSFFWYSQGQWQRMLVYEGNSGCTARILGLPATIRASDNSLAAEMTCRRFWACYIFNQFVSQPSFSKMVLSSLMKVPLPCDEIDFDRGVFPKERRTIAGVPGGSSFYRELIKLADLWNSVYLFIRDSDLGGSQKLLRIQTLDDQLRAWRRDLHETFELTPGILNAASRSVISQITLLHIGYHQSMCVLHSSIVPLFSLNPTGHDNAYAQKISAQTALEHARHVSAVFRDYLSPSGCTKQASGFVGYAAYCSCAIQLPFLGCTKPEVSLAARANIKLNYEIMGIIGHQWKIIKVLRAFLPHLQRYHTGNAYPLPGEPCQLSSGELNRHRGSLRRTTSSILGHNEILWNDGTIKNGGKVDDLELHALAPGHVQQAELPLDLSPKLPANSGREGQNYPDLLLDSSQLYDDATELMDASTDNALAWDLGSETAEGFLEQWFSSGRVWPLDASGFVI